MPIIAVPMTLSSLNHAKEITDFAVIGAPPGIRIQGDVQHLLDALHQIVAGATVTGDTTNSTTGIRTIDIDTKTVTASEKTDLDNMLAACLADINAVESTTPGVILKV